MNYYKKEVLFWFMSHLSNCSMLWLFWANRNVIIEALWGLGNAGIDFEIIFQIRIFENLAIIIYKEKHLHIADVKHRFSRAVEKAIRIKVIVRPNALNGSIDIVVRIYQSFLIIWHKFIPINVFIYIHFNSKRPTHDRSHSNQ